MKLSKGHVSAGAIAVLSALNFLGLLVWTRLLSPSEFGIYTLISVTSLLVNAFAFEWLRQTGARLLFSSDDPFELDSQISDTLAAMCIALSACLGFAALCLWLADVHILGLRPVWWLLIWLWVVSEMLLALTLIAARLRLLSWRFFAMMTARAGLTLGLGAMLVAVYDLGAMGIVVGVIAAQCLVAFVAILTDPAWRRIRPWRAREVHLKTILHFGAPLILSTGLVFLSGIADRYILSFTLGVEATGQYSVASDLMQKTVIFVMLAINITAYPQIVRAFETKGAEAGTARLADNFVMLLFVSLPVAVAFGVMARGLSEVVVGDAFDATMAVLLPWVALAAVMRGLMTFHLSVALQAIKKTRLLIAAPLITLAVLIPAGFAGAKIDGLRGMAISVALAQTISFAVFAAMVGRYIDLGLVSKRTLVAFVLAMLLGAALFPFRNVTEPIFLSAVLGGAFAVYGCVVAALSRERTGLR